MHRLFRTFAGLTLLFTLLSEVGFSQTAVPIGGQVTSYTAERVRGYYFTAPCDMTICQIYVPEDMNSNQWHCEIVRFNSGPPPAYAATTNNFTSLFYANNQTGNTPITCNVTVSAGDVIGVYGARSGGYPEEMANSYGGAQYNSSICGNNVTLYRSGMQFPLNNQQMHDIWSENSGNIGRVQIWYNCCATSTAPTAINATSNPICPGDATSLSQSGGSLGQNATYEWYSGSCGGTYVGSGASVSVSPSVSTNYFVRAEGSCDTTTCANLTVNVNDPTASPVTTDETCGSCNGQIDIQSASGGSAPYQYSIDGGTTFQSNQTFTNLCAGTYNIVVEDNIGCQYTTTATINNIPGPTDLSVNITQATCGSNNGQIDITGVTGGTSPYQYQVDGSGYSATTNYTGLSAGSHTVSVQDDNGCVYQETINITAAGSPTITGTTLVDASCNGNCDGSIDIQASGGTAPLQYSDDGGTTFQVSNTFAGLCAGTYDLVVEDANGCQFTDQVVINEPAPLAHDTIITNLQCYQDGTGAIEFEEVQGGTKPYQFSIDGGTTYQSDSLFQNLSAGTFNYVIEDANNCTFSGQIVVSEPAQLTATTNNTNSNCGAADGSASVTSVNGGTSPYSYQWDDPSSQTTATANNLTPGNYEVTITDANGCTLIDTVTVGNNTAQTITVDNVIDASCYAGCDGEAQISVTGGATPYTYQWDDPSNQTSQDATGLCAGDYTVIVTDDNGCVDSTSVTINEPTQVQIATDPTLDTTICLGGTATLTGLATGGTPGYTYHWDNGLGTGQVQNVSPGTTTNYFVYAEDANGCLSDSSRITVDYLPPLSVTASSDDSICPGGTAQISANGSGGDGNLSFSWSNGASTQSTTVSPANTTEFVVTLDDGCETPQVTDTVEVTVNPLPNVAISGNDLEGCRPVNATLINSTNSSMVGNNVQWRFGDGSTANGQDTIQHVFSTPGCYDVTLAVTSPEGCVDSTTNSNMVCVYPYPDADFEFTPEKTTVSDPELSFLNLSTGSTDHLWTFGTLDSSSNDNPVYSFPSDTARTYTVCLNATSTKGCMDTVCKDVMIGGEFFLYVPNAFTPDGDGVNDEFGPVIQGEDPKEYSFYVFDRWGEVVFETNDPEEKWSGSIDKANETKSDVYVWKVVARSSFSGKTIKKTGHVTLIR